jgi:hypothetical protein
VNLRTLFVTCSISFFLIGCGVAPNQKPISEPEKKPPFDTDMSGQEQKALENIEARYANSKDINERNLSLLILANNYKSADDCRAVSIVIKHTQGSLNNSQHVAISNLLKAECALDSIGDTSDSINKQPLLSLVIKWLETANENGINSAKVPLSASLNTIDFATRAQIASARLLAQNKQYASALHQLLNANIIDNLVDHPKLRTHFYNKAWEWFSLLDQDARAQLAATYPTLSEYIVFLNIVEDASLDDNARQASIKQWLSTRTNLMIVSNLPTQIQQYLSIEHRQNQNIAVLLPLSGRLSAQGEAIQQGILSAYYHKLASAKKSKRVIQSTIEFIDTGSLNTLNTDITAESLVPYDTIIGPLLRSHIDEINALNLVPQRQLVLNQTQPRTKDGEGLLAAFSLSPEEEAQQIVALMRTRTIRNPVVIDDSSATAKRMNNAFIAAWKATGVLSKNGQVQALQQISYTDNNSMRVGITSALDVLQSQRRIKQLSNLHQERVHSVTRNRRDVDAFVVFARPNDLELINPIIESSISLFTNEQIPVFAASYGYDHKQSKNSQRDLRNLIFVDMPWLLSIQRGDPLSASIDALFNKPPSTFLRLFAFGYDALSVVGNLAQLSTFEHLAIKGLSGDLSINSSQQLTRELTWLSINELGSQ